MKATYLATGRELHPGHAQHVLPDEARLDPTGCGPPDDLQPRQPDVVLRDAVGAQLLQHRADGHGTHRGGDDRMPGARRGDEPDAAHPRCGRAGPRPVPAPPTCRRLRRRSRDAEPNLTPVLSTDEILFGLGLVLVLAVGSQLAARRLGLPAIVVLLPAGFIAGAATDDTHPDALLGGLYQPFVSLAVGGDPVRGRVAPVVRRGRGRRPQCGRSPHRRGHRRDVARSRGDRDRPVRGDRP